MASAHGLLVIGDVTHVTIATLAQAILAAQAVSSLPSFALVRVLLGFNYDANQQTGGLE